MSQEAQDFLAHILSSGPQSTIRLYPWAEQKGINRKALSRAAKQLKLQRVQDPENGRYKIWSLQDTSDKYLGHETSTQDNNTGHEPETLDINAGHETQDNKINTVSKDVQDCPRTWNIDSGHSDTVLEPSDTTTEAPDTAKTVSTGIKTVQTVTTTAATVADLDFTDQQTVIAVLQALVDEDEFEVIDNFAMAQDRSYQDILNTLLKHGIKRVIRLQRMRASVD